MDSKLLDNLTTCRRLFLLPTTTMPILDTCTRLTRFLPQQFLTRRTCRVLRRRPPMLAAHPHSATSRSAFAPLTTVLRV